MQEAGRWRDDVIAASEEEITPFLAGHDEVSLAAVDSPDSLVISGDPEAVADLAAHFQAQGRKVKTLRVSHAFHSPHMDSAVEQFQQVAAQVAYQPLNLGLISNVTGRRYQPGIAPTQGIGVGNCRARSASRRESTMPARRVPPVMWSWARTPC